MVRAINTLEKIAIMDEVMVQLHLVVDNTLKKITMYPPPLNYVTGMRWASNPL